MNVLRPMLAIRQPFARTHQDLSHVSVRKRTWVTPTRSGASQEVNVSMTATARQRLPAGKASALTPASASVDKMPCAQLSTIRSLFNPI